MAQYHVCRIFGGSKSCRVGIAFLALLIVACSPANGNDTDINKFPAKLEGRVFDGLAEFTESRNSALKRYSFLASGEMVVTEPNSKAGIFPFFMIRTEDQSRSYHYQAYGEVRLADFSDSPTDRQTWEEFLQIDRRVKIRRGPVISNRPYISPTQEEKLFDFLMRHKFRRRYLDPYDDVLSIGNDVWSRTAAKNFVEMFFLRKCVLTDIEVSLGDQLVSTWTYTNASGEYAIKLFHSKAVDDLPVRTEYTIKGRQGDILTSSTRCRWEKQDGNWLPKFLDVSCPTNSGKSGYLRHWLISLQWCVGKDLSEDFFDTSAADLREASRKKFDAAFSRYENGQLLLPAWESPQEIQQVISRLPKMHTNPAGKVDGGQ